ncbi:MAG: S4 domain-containing protein [Gammaproteobacteria bacterium]|nr:S4 domain-containing protein [Gammaproteobacteria bacterium]|tara:strand:- start:235 stop:642 length:408 start_codon:yes stop_codon:yes gene_type:complete
MASSSKSRSSSKQLTRIRLDKWLWAARFYKSRAIAKQAIEGGKVHCEGARTKPSKEIEAGMQLKLRQGFDEKTVLVKALSEQRRPAPEAQLLYAETTQSIANREQLAEQRKAQPKHWPTATKPNKKQRRMIQRFK